MRSSEREEGKTRGVKRAIGRRRRQRLTIIAEGSESGGHLCTAASGDV